MHYCELRKALGSHCSSTTAVPRDSRKLIKKERKQVLPPNIWRALQRGRLANFDTVCHVVCGPSWMTYPRISDVAFEIFELVLCFKASSSPRRSVPHGHLEVPWPKKYKLFMPMQYVLRTVINLRTMAQKIHTFYADMYYEPLLISVPWPQKYTLFMPICTKNRTAWPNQKRLASWVCTSENWWMFTL